MAIPSDVTIKRQLKRLRRVIENESDPITRTIAYEVEQAIRWAREDTNGWQKPLESVRDGVELLRKRLVETQAYQWKEYPPQGDPLRAVIDELADRATAVFANESKVSTGRDIQGKS